jgi:iron complex outermembrane receptor protein
LWADEFIPQLEAHAKPQPFAVTPLYNINQAGGEMPYVQAQAEPSSGAIDTVMNSSTRTVLLGSSYNSATGGHETFVDVRKKGTLFYGNAVVVDESAGSYDGASGEEVRFGYERQAGQVVLGITPTNSRDIKLIYIRDTITDNKNPIASGVSYNDGDLVIAEGYGVDPIDTDRQIAKVMWDESVNGAVVKDLHLELSSVSLDRIADNYSLRDTASAQQQRSVVERTVNRFNIASDLEVVGSTINLSLDYADISHDAQRYGGPTTSGLDAVSAYHYPGVTMDEWLVSARSMFDINAQQTLTLGTNYKYVDANATKATLATNTPSAGSMSSLELYQTYFGDVDLAQHEGHGSAKLQWDYTNQADVSGYVSLAHFARSPDSQERYFAVTSFTSASSQAAGTSARAVGNPEIDWEKHRRIEMGGQKSSRNWVGYGQTQGHGRAWHIGVTAYYDDINDFITRDRATGQTSTGVSDYARIWRNVDATLAAVALNASVNMTNQLASRLVINLTDGENRTDHRDLYYIAPFEANLFLDYADDLNTGGTWNVGTQLRYVAEQNQVDADPTSGSGYDGGEADAFMTIGLYASAQLRDRYGIKLGIDNLTNESYTDTMAAFSLEGNRVLVEAPERSFYVALTANF